MNMTISGHHLEVTPALRGYVTSKLDRITRHFDQVVDVKVLLTVDNMKEKDSRQRAECNVHVKGRDIFAESSHADLYAAVDELTDKLDRQVARHKTKTKDPPPYFREASARSARLKPHRFDASRPQMAAFLRLKFV
jgi:putative sigma-54 modulation protein